MAGNFKKHSTGWEYRFKYIDPITDKQREKSQRGFAKKSDAENALKEFIRQLEVGIEIHDMRLSEWLIVWLEEYKKGTIRKNTIKSHQNSINNHIIPYFQHITLKALRPVMYQKFLNTLGERGYKRRTIEIVHSTMYDAMKKAVTIGKIEKNPCEGVTIKGEKNDIRDIKFIDSDDVPLLLKTAYQYGYTYWIFFKVLIETGMRKGEAAALQWTDINLKDMTIDVNKTLDFQTEPGEELFGDTKTFNSPRTIKISQSLANDLREHMKYQNRNKVNMNDLYRHDLNLVLCKDDGNHMPKSSLFNAFERILFRANLPRVPIHALRHTHAVIMLEAGADMKYVQERLGHGSFQITADVYSHVSKKLETKNMDKYESKMNELFGTADAEL